MTIVLWAVFEDQLFTKGSAKELVEEQRIFLVDEFSLNENESMYAPGDYYHTFILKISNRDTQHAILEIKNSTNFKKINGDLDDVLYRRQGDYFGSKVVRNYETNEFYVREYFLPSGKKGYAPTFRRISISKMANELIFEDINE